MLLNNQINSVSNGVKLGTDRFLSTNVSRNTMKNLNQGSRPRYYTPNEVSTHNTASDIWVSFLGHVYDLTKLAEEHSGLFRRTNSIE